MQQYHVPSNGSQAYSELLSVRNDQHWFSHLTSAVLGVCCCLRAFSGCSEGLLLWWCLNFPWCWLLLSWRVGSGVVAHRLSSPVTCGLFLDQGQARVCISRQNPIHSTIRQVLSIAYTSISQRYCGFCFRLWQWIKYCNKASHTSFWVVHV